MGLPYARIARSIEPPIQVSESVPSATVPRNVESLQQAEILTKGLLTCTVTRLRYIFDFLKANESSVLADFIYIIVFASIRFRAMSTFNYS